MKQIFAGLACAAALCLASPAQAALVTFDPGSSVLVDIDPQTGATRYDEAGFRFSAPDVAFVPVDGLGTAGSDALLLLAGGVVSFGPADGSTFGLTGLDFSGDLLVEAAVNGMWTLSEHLVGTSLASFSFSPAWTSLSQVRFSAQTDAVIDSIGAVPEPGSWALAGLGLLALATQRRRARDGSTRQVAGQMA
jgi:hypothetical protein